MIDEKIMKELMRMLHDRRDWYDERARDSKDEMRYQFEGAATAYNACCWMLDYALHGDTDALAQYDYFGKGD